MQPRLAGVDAARGLALAGMMAVHVLPSSDDDGSATPVFEVVSGRASALFAVLAGVGLALGSGGTHPPEGARLRAARRAIAARAAVVLAVGLTLASLGATVAVILAYYGVLFLTALPVLAWPARRLAVLAAGCALAAPVASLLLRSADSGGGPGENVSWSDLQDPVRLLTTVVLYGYYPVLTWTCYLFAGLAVGRCDLRRTATAARVAVTGAGLALAALTVDRAARSVAGGTPALAADLGTTGPDLEFRLTTSLYGTTPTASWWWLLLAGRHSGSGPDLVHTTGTALLVLGASLLLLPRLGRAAVVASPLVAAGGMTLTLYTLHVLALAGLGVGGEPGQVPGAVVLAAHLLFAGLVALAVGAPGKRGPLEALASLAARRAGPAGREARLTGTEDRQDAPDVTRPRRPGG